MSAPNDQEYILIAQLRERIGNILITDEQRSDAFLLRWIRAQDHDLYKAEEMLRMSIKWRSKHSLDQNHGSFPLPDPRYSEMLPCYFESDKLGRPVVILPLAEWNVVDTRPADLEEEQTLEYYFAYLFEAIMESLRAWNTRNSSSWPVTQITLIVDWNGFAFSQLLHRNGFKVFLKSLEIFDTHYPESLRRVLQINCPAPFPLFFAMMKRVLRPKSLAVGEFYRGKEEWRRVLLEEIGEEFLPVRYGGKKKVVQDKV